jgi:hypothetical protein
VSVLQKREPGGVQGGGGGSIAAEADRVPGPVFVMSAPEGKKMWISHREELISKG